MKPFKYFTSRFASRLFALPLSVCFIALLGSSFTGCLDDTPEVYKVKFTHVVSPNTPKGKAAEFFAKRVDELSEGRIKVEIFPNAQLSDDDRVFQELTRNNVQMAAPGFSKFTPIAREFSVWDTPFLFENIEQVHAITDGDIGQKMREIISSRGVVALAYWDGGFKHFSTNKAPILLPSDLNGQKIRIMGSKVIEEQMKNLGATPYVMPFSEVYKALSSNLVDGAENPLTNIYNSNLYEVQSSITLSKHGYLGYLVVVSESFWKQLPDELKEIFQAALKEATEFEREESAKEEKAVLELFRQDSNLQQKLIELDSEQKGQWREELRKIYPKLEAIIGSDLINQILTIQNATKREENTN